MIRSELLQACAITAQTFDWNTGNEGPDHREAAAYECLKRATALLECVDKACCESTPDALDFVKDQLRRQNAAIEAEALRTANLAVQHDHALQLLRQAWEAMNAHAEDMLREHGCASSADRLEEARDAIAAAFPEVER